jgi:hypothetical protein
MKLGLIFVAASALAIACASNPCPPNDPRVGAACPQPSDAGADGPLPATCAGACTNMRRLGCEHGKPTPKGATCEQVCDNVQRENAGAGFNVACIVQAASCAAADSCR